MVNKKNTINDLTGLKLMSNMFKKKKTQTKSIMDVYKTDFHLNWEKKFIFK